MVAGEIESFEQITMVEGNDLGRLNFLVRTKDMSIFHYLEASFLTCFVQLPQTDS